MVACSNLTTTRKDGALYDLRVPSQTLPRIFISYSHKDGVWLQKLQVHLRTLERSRKLEVWADTKIRTGAHWRENIEKALAWANVAVLLVTPDFLDSDFIQKNELPPLLEAAAKERITIVWIAVKHTVYDETAVGKYQCANEPSRPLESLTEAECGRELVRIAKKILDLDAALSAASDGPHSESTIQRVLDPADPLLYEALTACKGRIPDDEMYDAPDIVRWLRHYEEQRHAGDVSCHEYLLVAKSAQQVGGFFYFHYYARDRIAFVSYLARCSPSSDEPLGHQLLRYVRQLLRTDADLADCRGFLMEVDNPQDAAGEERRRRLARIKLFCTLAEAYGAPLRVLQIPYCQPKLSLESPEAKEKPMLLAFAFRERPAILSELPRPFVKDVLKFVYGTVYPDAYSDDDKETRRYIRYLNKVCRSIVVPAKVPALEWNALKALFPED